MSDTLENKELPRISDIINNLLTVLNKYGDLHVKCLHVTRAYEDTDGAIQSHCEEFLTYCIEVHVNIDETGKFILLAGE